MLSVILTIIFMRFWLQIFNLFFILSFKEYFLFIQSRYFDVVESVTNRTCIHSGGTVFQANKMAIHGILMRVVDQYRSFLALYKLKKMPAADESVREDGTVAQWLGDW